MKICHVKVRVESEDTYWREQVQRLQAAEKAGRAGKAVRTQGTELVFTSLKDMARTLTPKRLDLLRLIRRERPTSVRGLARLAGRDLKNVLADVNALETLGLVASEGGRKERSRRALRTDFERIEVHVEL